MLLLTNLFMLTVCLFTTNNDLQLNHNNTNRWSHNFANNGFLNNKWSAIDM